MFVLWALGPWLLVLPLLAPWYAARWVLRSVKGVLTIDWESPEPATVREPAVGRAKAGSVWEAVLDDRTRSHDMLVIDDPYQGPPPTPEQRETVQRWFQETLRARTERWERAGIVVPGALEKTGIVDVKKV